MDVRFLKSIGGNLLTLLNQNDLTKTLLLTSLNNITL